MFIFKLCTGHTCFNHIIAQCLYFNWKSPWESNPRLILHTLGTKCLLLWEVNQNIFYTTCTAWRWSISHLIFNTKYYSGKLLGNFLGKSLWSCLKGVEKIEMKNIVSHIWWNHLSITNIWYTCSALRSPNYLCDNNSYNLRNKYEMPNELSTFIQRFLVLKKRLYWHWSYFIYIFLVFHHKTYWCFALILLPHCHIWQTESIHFIIGCKIQFHFIRFHIWY